MTALQFSTAIVLALGAAVRGNWSPCGESLQAQLHPMGERSRGNVWGATILAFTIGSAAAGGLLGAVSGTLGAVVVGRASSELVLIAMGVAAVAAGALDLAGIRPWTPRRQVNENWIGRYRGWAYGAAFGIQLGVGFTVFVMSWSYWAMLFATFLMGQPLLGALVGAVFGVGRGLLLYASKRINTPAELIRFHTAMAAWKQRVFTGTAATTLMVGVATITTLML